MIALVISSAWPKYYASSPFLNLHNSDHPRFAIFRTEGITAAQLAVGGFFNNKENNFEAVIADDVLVHHIKNFKGPKFMIGGDPHAHQPFQVERLIGEYGCVDYVLTGAVFSKKLKDRYLYPPDHLWDKHLYFPHMVPDVRPEVKPFAERRPKAVLTGSIDPLVYPYRARCKELKGDQIDYFGLNNYMHSEYFQRLADYQMAITCNSNFEYTVAKYFEIPWTGTVLLAPQPSTEECELVGFENGENVMWCCSPEEALRLAKNIADVAPLFKGLARDGEELMKRHTAYQRLDYIAHLVDRIKQSGFTPEDAKDCFLKHRKGELDAGLARDVAGK